MQFTLARWQSITSSFIHWFEVRTDSLVFKRHPFKFASLFLWKSGFERWTKKLFYPRPFSTASNKKVRPPFPSSNVIDYVHCKHDQPSFQLRVAQRTCRFSVCARARENDFSVFSFTYASVCVCESLAKFSNIRVPCKKRYSQAWPDQQRFWPHLGMTVFRISDVYWLLSAELTALAGYYSDTDSWNGWRANDIARWLLAMSF